jgi:hypothetical protein
MGALISSWPAAFVWTCALELPVYTLFLGRRFPRWWSVCVLAFAVNLATHPAVWFLFPRFHPREAWFLAAEGLVTGAEAALIAATLARSASWRSACRLGLLAALAANTVSASVAVASAVTDALFP